MAPSDPRRRAAGVVPLLVVILALCGCSGDERRSPGGPTPGAAAESGRPLPPNPPAEPSVEIGLALFRKGDLKGAEPHLVGALREAPRDRRILEALGAIYERTDRYRQAEESFRQALQADGTSAIAHLGLGSVLLETGRYDEASEQLAQARRIDPGNLGALRKGALLEARRGHPAAARELARQALGRNGEDVEAHYVLGLAALQEGALPEAEAEMRRARAAAPDHLGALSHLAAIEARLGRSREAEEARAAYSTALGRRRVEERVRKDRLEGVEAFNRQDYAGALVHFQAIEREDPNDPQVHLHLGSTYIGLGRLDDARAELSRCLSLDPRSDRGLAELGRLLALQGRLEEAIEALQKAAAANPEFAEPHYYLAGIHRARGDLERSAAEMRRFEELRSRSGGAATEVVPAGEEER
jgi:Flp pilus assembly protein TadD